MTAFLTGSHAYGKPRPNSDTDLVILVDDSDLEKLIDAADKVRDRRVGEYGEDSASLYFGNLNLICVTSFSDFDLWEKGTLDLKRQKIDTGKPITRKEAKAHFAQLRWEREQKETKE